MTTPPPSALLRARLLHATLEAVPEFGWSKAAIAAAARAEGLSAGEALIAAPNGVIDLIDAFAEWADEQMAARLTASNVRALKIRARVAAAVRARLEALAPHKLAVGRSLAWVALHRDGLTAARLGWRTADRIWTLLGDRSTDENYYSKRAILSAVHGATLARWLADDDPEAKATWAFLDARIGNVMQFEQLKARAAPLTLVGDVVVGALARARYAFER